MDELLRKLAVEGWWLWALLLVVVSMVYLSRHRTGLGAVARAWQPWENQEELKSYLGPDEQVVAVEGALAVTDRRVLVRKTGSGTAFAQAALGCLVNVEYSETWTLPAYVAGAFYIAAGLAATVFSGGAHALAVLGLVIAAAGAALALAAAFLKPATLTLTFSSGRPLIIGGRIDEGRLKELVAALGRSA